MSVAASEMAPARPEGRSNAPVAGSSLSIAGIPTPRGTSICPRAESRLPLAMTRFTIPAMRTGSRTSS